MTKYGFETLEIGESLQLFAVDAKRVRSSAYMWGRRYGKWFKVETAPDKSIFITRLAYSHFRPKPRKPCKTVEDRLNELKDALRCLTLLLLEVKKKTDAL